MRIIKRYFILAAVIIPLLLTACATGKFSEKEMSGDMVLIPKGWFIMGFNQGEINEKPEHEVFLETFLMDKYEVSAYDFAIFLNEKGNPDERYFSHDQYSTIIGVSYVNGNAVETKKNPEKYIPRKGFENYPANNISWFGADAYCSWKGKRLPTEAEWEKAARSEDGRLYPWGNSKPDTTKARYDQKWEEKDLNVMVPVDDLSAGKSYYGAFNMAGNVWEWTNDWYRQNYCEFCNPGNEFANIDVAMRLAGTEVKNSDVRKKEINIPPMDNPEGPSFGIFKTLRGGSWFDSYAESTIRTSYRYWFYPEQRYLHTGFRCVSGEAKIIKQPSVLPKEPERKMPEVKQPEKITEIPLAKVEPIVESPRYIEEKTTFEDIFFDFDQYDIRPDARPALQAIASWLLKNKAAHILAEGHCDERGTNEYNLALGDRRAKAVKDYLFALGIASGRIEIVSYGEEKPFCSDHTEECWAKNRRAHFVILRDIDK
jgi:peptidoglycan-associated lipoprotein